MPRNQQHEVQWHPFHGAKEQSGLNIPGVGLGVIWYATWTPHTVAVQRWQFILKTTSQEYVFGVFTFLSDCNQRCARATNEVGHQSVRPTKRMFVVRSPASHCKLWEDRTTADWTMRWIVACERKGIHGTIVTDIYSPNIEVVHPISL